MLNVLPQMVGSDGLVTSLAMLGPNVVAVGGAFTHFGGLPCSALCLWDAQLHLAAPGGILGGLVFSLAQFTSRWGERKGLLVGGVQLRTSYFHSYSAVYSAVAMPS